MRSKLERVEADLAAAQKAIADGTEMLKLAKRKKEAIQVEVDQLKEKGETMEAKYKRAEHENSQLKREVDEL